MYNYSGLYFRIWGVCGIVALIGVCCLLITLDRSAKNKKETFVAGILALVVAVVMGSIYFSAIQNPDITVLEGVFVEEYRDSRVAPPLPVTHRYVFADRDGKRKFVYLDMWSKKEIHDEAFIVDQKYRITYEAKLDVIVAVEVLDGGK